MKCARRFGFAVQKIGPRLKKSDLGAIFEVWFSRKIGPRKSDLGRILKIGVGFWKKNEKKSDLPFLKSDLVFRRSDFSRNYISLLQFATNVHKYDLQKSDPPYFAGSPYWREMKIQNVLVVLSTLVLEAQSNVYNVYNEMYERACDGCVYINK